jgi:aubergine-like protein
MIMKERGALLNVDVAFRVVRTDSLLDYMNQVRDKAEQKNKDWQEALEDAVVGSTVVTRYNQKTYRVERIDFSMSPETTFDREGTQVSYSQYYKEKYQENINDSNQPLLINKDRKTGVEIALIPELC